jgi:hypothetical protein
MDLTSDRSDAFYVDVHVPESSKLVEGVSTWSERTVRWELPKETDPEQIQKAAAELEKLAKLLHENPEFAADLLQALMSNDYKAAREITQRVGGAIIVDPIIIIIIIIIIVLG